MNQLRSIVWCLPALLLACQNAGPGAAPAKQDPGVQSPQKAAAAESPQPSSAGRLPAGQVVATWTGGQLTYGELTEKGKDRFVALHKKYVLDVYQAEQAQIQGTITDMLIEQEAAKVSLTPEKYLEGIAGNEKPTDGEARAFFEQNLKGRGMEYDMVKDRLMQMLEQKKQQENVQAKLEALRKAAGVNVTLPAPEEAMAKFDLKGRPSKGPDDAKVTIVEFSDFECPYCAKALPGVDALLAKYKDDVKIYFLHFPLSFHQKALPAAIASECANRQGKFWEMHDKIFGAQHALTEETFLTHAKELSLNAAEFKGCLAKPEVKAFVEADMAQGTTAGVQGTPSFFINGVQYQGIPTTDVIEQALQGS